MIETEKKSWIEVNYGGRPSDFDDWFQRGAVKLALQSMGVKVFDAYDRFEIRHGTHQTGIVIESLGVRVGMIAFTDSPNTETGMKISQTLAEDRPVIVVEATQSIGLIDWSPYTDSSMSRLHVHNYVDRNQIAPDLLDLVGMHMSLAIEPAVELRPVVDVQ